MENLTDKAICVKCKYMRKAGHKGDRSNVWYNYLCKHYERNQIDYVTGKSKTIQSFCATWNPNGDCKAFRRH